MNALTPGEWARLYGVGEIVDYDVNGDPIYEDYRVPPEVQAATTPAPRHIAIDGSWLALVMHWRLVVAELIARGIDLHSETVLNGPWLSVRAAIFDLLDSPTRLREVLKEG